MIIDEDGTFIDVSNVDINDDVLDVYDFSDTIDLTNITKNIEENENAENE